MGNMKTKIKKGDEDRKVGRLTEMDTREVSIVDRAANGTRFLIVKRDQDTEESMGKDAKTNAEANNDAATAVLDPPAAAEAETSKRVVGARVEEVLSRVQAAKSVISDATTTDETTGFMPTPIGKSLRAAQFLLKGVAGVTKASLLIPSGDSLESVTEIESAVQKGTIKILDEVERRLETMKADLAEVDMVDPTQSREIDGCADLIGKALVDYPTKTSQALVVVKSSLSDEDRAALMADLEKAMGEIGEVYMGLMTESIGKADVAGADEIGLMIHEATSSLESTVAKMAGDERSDINKAVELVRGMTSVAKDADVSKAVIGVLSPIAKAASMFKPRYHGDGYATVLSTADEVVAKFDTWEEAEMDSLARNIKAVTAVAKSATVEDVEKRFMVVEGGKGYQVKDETGKVFLDTDDEAAAKADAEKRNKDLFTSKTKKNEEGDDVAETDVSKVGRPMKGDRLNRLISTAKLLKDALGDMQAGSLSMEKFKKAATTLSDVIRECQVHKAAQLARGMDPNDVGSEDQNTPNHGSGVQPDSDATNAASHLAGEGTPDLSDVLKSEIAKARAEIRKEFQAEVDDLQGQVATLRKARAIPSTVPADSEGETVRTRKSTEKVVWGTDMNDESWGDED